MAGRGCILFLVLISTIVLLATVPGARNHIHRQARALRVHASLGASFLVEKNNATKVVVIDSEASAKSMAALHATGKKELMFTTYSFTHEGNFHPDALNSVVHIWENLRRIKRLNNSIIISYDLQTCQVLWVNGVPCFLDRYLPQPSELPGQYGSRVPHWYQKYAWALKFLEWGYRPTFFETDMYFLKDPFPHHDTSYDLEGLSDWHKASLPVAMDRYTSPCTVYHMEKGDDGGNSLKFGPINTKDIRAQSHINPCMSTGFWFIEPTEPAKEFLAAFIDLMLHWRNWQQDQLLWNEVIMAFLIGQKGHKPLRFSLLDDAKFSNFEVVRWRQEQSLELESVMMHAGGISGKDKEAYMREHGYWLGDEWDKSGGVSHITNLLKHFNRTLSR